MEKRKITNKLKLKKETIANLNPLEMRMVMGGETQPGSGYHIANACTIATRPTRAGKTCPIKECIQQ